MTEPTLSYRTVEESDFDALIELRIAAMRESLERIGRFDPARGRERLRRTFAPSATEWIVYGDAKIGFYAMRQIDHHYSLDHFYIHPNYQRRGIGRKVMERLKAQAKSDRLPIVAGALRGSDANRFYQREGFQLESEDEFDIYYVSDDC